MRRKIIYIVGGVAALILVVGIWLLYSYIRGVTADDVDTIIKSHIPIGSNTTDVSAFIDSLKIDSLRVENFGYRDLISDGVGPFDDRDQQLAGRAKGYLDARIHNTSRTYYLSQVEMNVRFYFDRNERLIDYQILEMFD